MSYWQIAAGSFGRDYSDRFLRHGLAFVGGEGYCATMTETQPGDIVVLKRGQSEIVAAGLVVERNGSFRSEGDKEWLWDFDGWELPAWCYVDWHVPQKPIATHGLTRATMQKIYQGHIVDQANRIIAENQKREIYDAEPKPTRQVSDDDLIAHLIKIGLRPGAAE